MQVQLQNTWDLVQVIFLFEILGLIAAVILTLYLLLKFRISGTAWLYAVAATIVFFFGGSTVAFLDGHVSIYLGNIIYIIGGYILILIALFRYIRDEDKTHTSGTSVLEP